MTNPAPRRPSPRPGVLVTGASGSVGQAVVDALAAEGQTVVAGMRDPRAWIAESARRASGTAAGQHPGGPGGPGGSGGPGGPGGSGSRPNGKPLRAPNHKPAQNPTHKPVGLAAASSGRPYARPAGGSDAPTLGGTTGQGARTGLGASADRGAKTDGTDGSGALVRAFDFADQATWARALAGVDRVFLIVPPTMGDVRRTIIPFIDQAMEESGVRQIVFLSAPGARLDARSPHQLVERYLKRTRTPYTILRPNLLMQTLSTRYRDDIRLRDEIMLPAAGGRAAFVDADDLGRAAARVLTEQGHLGKAYALTGEQAFSFAQVAALLTEVLGRPIRYTPTTEADFTALCAKQGDPAADIAAQAGWYRAMRRWSTAVPTRSIRRLTGRPATTLREFVEKNRHSWI